MRNELERLQPGRGTALGLVVGVLFFALLFLLALRPGAWVRAADQRESAEGYRRAIQRIDAALDRMRGEKAVGPAVIWLATTTEAEEEGVPETGGRIAGEALRLTGVAWSLEKPLAFINGFVAGVGEEVGGWRILEIRPARVRVEDAEGHVLELPVDAP